MEQVAYFRIMAVLAVSAVLNPTTMARAVQVRLETAVRLIMMAAAEQVEVEVLLLVPETGTPHQAVAVVAVQGDATTLTLRFLAVHQQQEVT
ncbi:hypothetical protein [Paenibacillus silvae]|uniref:hypothetical protein n=1 Tax=Paenibacillus silvae TaxID=1325358 RepID=UPI00142D72D1|nr:hypothetical protein [Paenibacillus silvae]